MTGKIGGEGQRMSPTEAAKNPHGKAPAENGGLVGIMMGYRRYSTEQIFQPAPPKADRLGQLELSCNWFLRRFENIFRPGHCVRVWSVPEPRKQIELQVVVGVYQSG